MAFRTTEYSLWKDVAERAAWTFAQGFLGTGTLELMIEYFGSGRGFDISLLRMAAAGGIMSLYSFIKGVVASQVGPPTAAMPEPVQTTTVAEPPVTDYPPDPPTIPPSA